MSRVEKRRSGIKRFIPRPFVLYCVAVKRLFDSKGLTYDEFNFDHEPDARYEVNTVIDNRGENPMFIGGFDETQNTSIEGEWFILVRNGCNRPLPIQVC